jgi:hypothetical protein
MSMKYYVYISGTKVDMLYSQIPKKIRDKIAVELGINLGMFSPNVKRKENHEKTRIEKLRLVVNYIENNMDVGTVGQPLEYFKGSLPMRWKALGSHSSLVYFGGITANKITIVGLGGSMIHVIGDQPVESSEPRKSSKVIGSQAVGIESVLYEVLKLPEKKIADYYLEDNTELLTAVSHVTRTINSPLQRLEFLAKRLVEGTHKEYDKSWHVVLGTPLYVAMAD